MTMFTEEFRERLRLGKYTKWAKYLNEDELEAILWGIGEYRGRDHAVLSILREHAPQDSCTHARAIYGLEAVARFLPGRKFGLPEYFKQFEAAMVEFEKRQKTDDDK